MSRGYDSPLTALAAIVDCLDTFCANVHVGDLGTGESLECCPGCLLRVETAGLRQRDGLPHSLHQAVKGCQPLILDVVINYRQCFTVFRPNSAAARPIADLTADGSALILTWWDVLRRLACCSGLNSLARFSSILSVPPDGNCAGWTMSLEVDVSICGCDGASGLGDAAPGAIGLTV